MTDPAGSPDAVRPLTPGERGLAAGIFGEAIDYAAVLVHRRRWWPLQPRNVAMAPDGDLWLHPRGDLWCADFSGASVAYQALFIHELTHVWQAQRGGRWYLPLARHPFCRYRYRLKAGKPFRRYGLEQQAMIVEHAWRARREGSPIAALEALLPFAPAEVAVTSPDWIAVGKAPRCRAGRQPRWRGSLSRP